MKSMSFITARPFVCLLALSFALAGCGSDNETTTAQSRVRVINALTGTTANVDVSVNGTPVATSLPFGSVTTTSTTVNAGTAVPITVVQTGTTNTLASTTTANITPNADVPILVTGTVGTTGTTAPTVIALSAIDLSGTPTSTQPRIYFVNSVP